LKIMYLALRNAALKWTSPTQLARPFRPGEPRSTSSLSSSVMSGCRSYKKRKIIYTKLLTDSEADYTAFETGSQFSNFESPPKSLVW
jgi:hypothetical protein